MLLQEIVDPLQLENSKEMVTIVGAGGKTSTLFMLAKELKSLGKRVLVTTTTAIYEPVAGDYDRRYTEEILDFKKKIANLQVSRSTGEIVVWGRKTHEEGKLRGINPEDIDEIWETRKFSWILVEGDGARGKNIKAPKAGEPVIPSKTTILIGVIGMEVLGKSIEEGIVHRIKHFTEVTGAKEGDEIHEALLRRLIFHENGLFKDKPGKAKGILLLNQCEDRHTRNRAITFADGLEISCLVTSLQNQTVYHAKKTGDFEDPMSLIDKKLL